MKKKKLKLLVLILFLTLLTYSSIPSILLGYSSNPKNRRNDVMIEESYNATSPSEFFNETKDPRYPLVARPFGIILYPHKGYPAIIEFNEAFNVLVNISAAATNWNLTIRSENTSIQLDILKETFSENIWILSVALSSQIEGLYDLQVNCSLSSDYQTHSVKVVEKKTYPFTFIHISDTHFPAYSEPINTTDINLQEIEKIKSLNPDFVILTGDVIQGPTWYFVNPKTGKPMSAEIQFRLAFWALDRLELPVYIIHGNHDYSHSTLLPDLPDVKWKKYMGYVRYQNFSFLDWSFIGYGSSFEGLNKNEMNMVKSILEEQSDVADVLYYHYDFESQASELMNNFPIEVALHGHDHDERTYSRKGTLVHDQKPLFERGFTLFTVINKTALVLNNITYDFTGFSLPITTTPTTSPTETSPFQGLGVGVITIFMVIGLLNLRRKRMKRS
ncbi:MAG: metallophosphoesterase family protein [Candidatus Heimdallarchaeaceae archaeon]